MKLGKKLIFVLFCVVGFINICGDLKIICNVFERNLMCFIVILILLASFYYRLKLMRLIFSFAEHNWYDSGRTPRLATCYGLHYCNLQTFWNDINTQHSVLHVLLFLLLFFTVMLQFSVPFFSWFPVAGLFSGFFKS